MTWALVTGASSGLGVALARRLAARGMSLVLTARREDRLNRLATELEPTGIETAVVPLDLARAEAPAELWARASEGRRIDVLVNNAGFGARGPFLATPRERHLEMLQLDVAAPLELMHLALAEMYGRGAGGVLNVSSVSAFQPLPGYATYAASKAYLQYLSEALWEEARHHGVRVTALCPGRVPTEFQSVAGSKPVGRVGGRVLPAEAVAEAGLRALERGRAFVVPGFANYLGTFAGTLLPRTLLMRLLGRTLHHLS